MQHVGVAVADDLVTWNPDDLGRRVHEPLVVELEEIASVVLVDDVADTYAV